MLENIEIQGKKIKFVQNLIATPTIPNPKIFTEDDALGLVTCPDLDLAIQRALQPENMWDYQYCRCRHVAVKYIPFLTTLSITGKCPKT